MILCLSSRGPSRGLTLIEVLLALGLTVLATGLIGGLIQIYQGELEIARDNVRQARLARAVLTMIADDVRGVVRDRQNDDNATLEQFLMGTAASSFAGGQQGGGGQGGGQQGGGGQGGQSGGGGQQTAGAPSSLSAGGTAAGAAPGGGGTGGGLGGATGGASGAASAAGSTDPMATESTAPLPPGIFGTDSSIEIDVSRPPRPDQYVGELANPLEGKLVDIPSDTKTVSYYVQAAQMMFGVQDPLALASGQTGASNGGLVRRSLDRAITRWAYDQGQTTQMSSSGQLIAGEIVAISFSYFDGLEWTTTWDSSLQGLPWAIEITIAMQHAKQARTNPLLPGMTMNQVLAIPRSESGVETFSMLAMVPGAQLLKTPDTTTTTDSSASSPTSSLGF